MYIFNNIKLNPDLNETKQLKINEYDTNRQNLNLIVNLFLKY